MFLLCFSVVSPTSFFNIRDKWLPEIRSHSSNCPIILVGTQCDLRTDVKVLIELDRYHEKPVSEQQAKKLAQEIGAACYLESSALTQKNMKEVFDTAILVGLQRNDQLCKQTLGKSRGQKLVARNAFGHHRNASNSPNNYYPNTAIQALQQGDACKNGSPSSGKEGSQDGPKKKWKKFLCLS